MGCLFRPRLARCPTKSTPEMHLLHGASIPTSVVPPLRQIKTRVIQHTHTTTFTHLKAHPSRQSLISSHPLSNICQWNHGSGANTLHHPNLATPCTHYFSLCPVDLLLLAGILLQADDPVEDNLVIGAVRVHGLCTSALAKVSSSWSKELAGTDGVLTKYATLMAWNRTLSGPPLPSSLSPAASGHGARRFTSSKPASIMASG